MRPSPRLRIPLLAITALWVLPIEISAQEWSRFRGPNGTGIGKGTNLPVQWEHDDYAWKIALPGIGHSSPVLWGNKLFVMSADAKTAERHVLCYAADSGKQIWKTSFASTSHHLHTRNSYASCTPAADGQRVYVSWSTPEETTLKALDHEGNEVWGQDLGRWVSQHGFGASPMLYKDMVILFNSQQAQQVRGDMKPGESFMLAFEAATGKLRWKAPRKSARVNYGTPCIFDAGDGVTQLLATSTAEGVFSLDPETGEKNWGGLPFKMRTVSSPIVAGGLVFGSTGSGGGGNYIIAVKPGPETEVVYEINRNAPYVPTPVAREDLVFLFGDKGVGTCIDAKTGQIHWRQRLGSGFSASPVIADGKVYGVDEDGVVVAVAATKEFKLLGKTELGEASRATPAIANNKLYFRTYSHLMAIGG